MTELIIVRYLHFIAIFAITGAIISEQFLISKSMTRKEMKLISKMDIVYIFGIFSVIIAGLLLWFSVGKPASFYSRNWLFHTKLTMFVILAITSIYPILFFLKNKKGEDPDTIIEVPTTIILLLRFELAIIIIMPILASYISLGIGTF